MKKSPGKCIVFHGGKSGEGKSLIAQNTAACLARQGRARVILFDADMQGRAEHFIRWNLPAGQTVSAMAAQLNRFDPNTIRGFFPKSRSGVEVAVLAESEAKALDVSSHQIMQVLSLLQEAYDYVVVDGTQGWDALTLSILDLSDLVLMVCSPDLVALKQLRTDSLLLQNFKFPASKLGLVLNRVNLRGAMQPQNFEKIFSGYTLYAQLPWENVGMEALNQQTDIVSLYPNTPFVKEIKHLCGRIEALAAGRGSAGPVSGTNSLALPATVPLMGVKERLHAMLLDHAELKNLEGSHRGVQAKKQLREKVTAVVTSLMAVEAPEVTKRESREQLVREIVDEALGLGPLEDFMRDEAVTEIMVNRADQIYIEQAGRLQKTDKQFLNDKQLMTVIERIVAPLGRRVDESQPYVDARLPDGSRVHAIVPPLALQGPTLTIRKFSRKRLHMEDLVRYGSFTGPMADFMNACVQGRRNIVIAGGTGSGKTTLLNCLAAAIPDTERIVTVEDAAELNLPQTHVVTLEARPANIEGKGEVTIRDLVRNCLRMRPDRIVVGECRSGEALDMLQAMNTGHDGSITTVHANSPKDSLARLETMVLMSGMDLPIRAIREQMAGAVHVIVQQMRLQDGTRKVTRISEVTGLSEGAIQLEDVFTFEQHGVDGQGRVQGVFQATGYKPTFVDALGAKGFALDAALFKKTGKGRAR